ncbi:hypothetical protein GCM10020256_63680 [Streptomyces thermocoprophilus]
MGGACRGGLQVGVGEDDVGALAAEFEGDAFDAVGALGEDLLADGGRPREDDLGDAGVFHEGVPGDGAVTGQHLEEAFGQASGEGEFGEAQRGERGGLGGFQDHRVAGGECGRGAPGGDRHGEVPRGDDADHAERFEDRHVEAAGYGDLAAGQAFHSPGGVVEQVADVAGLPAGVADGVPGLADLQPGQFLQVAVDGGGEPAQQPRPVAGRQRGPAGLGAGGAGDGGVHVGGGSRRGRWRRRPRWRGSAPAVRTGGDLFGLVGQGGLTCVRVRTVGRGGLTCVRRSGAAPSR